MNLTRCENGHFYDQDNFDSCPHCKNGMSAGKAINLTRCENGHFYDLNKFDYCPYCKRGTNASVIPDLTWKTGARGAQDNRAIYLGRRHLLDCINKEYIITIIIVSEFGEYEKSVHLNVKGGEDADDILQKLRESGEMSFGREYSFANWPTVSPDWGFGFADQPKYVCELCEECKPQRFVALLKYSILEKDILGQCVFNDDCKKFGKDTFTLLNKDGEEVEFECLFTFDAEETGKCYIVYTDNTVDEEENLKIYASVYNPEASHMELMPIESDREWEIIETIVEAIQEAALES